MKRNLLKIVSSIILTGIFVCLLSALSSAELKASFSLKGPTTVRAGDTVTIQIKADGEGILGIRAEITYDKNQLIYSTSSGVLSKWKVEITEENGKLSIWAEENNDFKSPINSSVTLVKLNFKASEKLKTDDKISVKLKVLEASSTEDSIENLSASYSVNVSRPLSDNCDLASLSVEGYTVSPQFSASVTDYEIEGEVAYTSAPLKINAKAKDGEADVEISGSRLSVGENTIRIKVTAEDGVTVKTYRIKAVMAQDPDYVLSSDSTLSQINVSEGRLSPAFSPSVHNYIVYVPYEITSVTVTSSATDSRAVPPETVEAELLPDDNEIRLVCTAEDGTESIYTVHVMRMPDYSAADTDTGTGTDTGTDTEEYTDTGSDTETETEDTAANTFSETTDTETVKGDETAEVTTSEEPSAKDPDTEPEESDTDIKEPGDNKNRMFPLWALFVAAAAGLVLGGAVSILVFNFSNERK
ncbi:MAG: cadherin-like beta sandwich domain-containing protein [Clostridia bacterium]|nr:cadherin-like beta sandwich domain-containing protein [Clostridia bacterium]